MLLVFLFFPPEVVLLKPHLQVPLGLLCGAWADLRRGVCAWSLMECLVI